MELYISNDILIKSPNEKMKALLASMLVVDNPEYEQKLRLGKWTGGTPETLTLYQREGQNYRVPYGFESFLDLNDFDYIHYDFKGFSPIWYGSNIKLRKYQFNAVNMAKERGFGIIVAPCGSGKTQMGLELAAQIGGKTLWITHTSELLNQSMARAKSCFSALHGGDFGTITAGKVDIGNVITFATVQTLSKIDLRSISDTWDTIIVDEAHHAVGTPTKLTMFYKVISQLKAPHKYGLTATPKRADGLTNCMYYLLGKKICEITREDIASYSCPVFVQFYNTGFSPDISKIVMPDGTLSFTKLVNNLCNDDGRNQMLCNCALSLFGLTLILTSRVAHCHTLKTMIGKSAEIISGNISSKDRSRILGDFKNGGKRILISTYALAKEGLDIPALENLILATPQKDSTIVAQSAGRVARACDGKREGIIYDFVDDFPMLIKWGKIRESVYKKSGYSARWI